MTSTDKQVPRQRYWETADFWKDFGERMVTAFIGGCVAVMSPYQFDLVHAPLSWQIVIIGGGGGAVLQALASGIGSRRRDSMTPVGIM